MSPLPRHVYLEHTSEVELLLEAEDLPGLFAEAARALAEVMGADAPLGALGPSEGVTVRARDLEGLLVEWLNELIFRCETSKRLFPDVRIDGLTETELLATLRGAEPSALKTQVKAASYHRVHIAHPDTGGYSATVVLDV